MRSRWTISSGRVIPAESVEQERFFSRVRVLALNDPRYLMIAAIPNGEYRSPAIARALKDQGVMAGYPDITVDVAASGCHGLRIELKRKDGGRVSAAQSTYIDRLREQGYAAEVCAGADDALRVLAEYLAGDYTRRAPCARAV